MQPPPVELCSTTADEQAVTTVGTCHCLPAEVEIFRLLRRHERNTAVPVAILVRVSTAKQETTRQVSELQPVVEAKGWQVVAVCEEQAVSGRADQDQRHGLKKVERLARAGKIKKVLVHEISRLGRRNSIAHSFIEMLQEVGVSRYWHAQVIETMMANGRRNTSAVLLGLLVELFE